MVVRQGMVLAIIQLALGLRTVIPHLIQANAIAGTSMCSFVANCERSETFVTCASFFKCFYLLKYAY